MYPGTVAQEVQANTGSSHGSEHHQRTTTHGTKHTHNILFKIIPPFDRSVTKGLG